MKKVTDMTREELVAELKTYDVTAWDTEPPVRLQQLVIDERAAHHFQRTQITFQWEYPCDVSTSYDQQAGRVKRT